MAMRRGNNEGAIYQKKNGKWQAQILIGGKRLSRSFSTRKEGIGWLKEVIAQKDKGMDSSDMNVTFQAFVSRWLLIIKSRIRIRTWQQYKTILEVHLIPEFGHRRLSEIKPVDIQYLYSKKLADGIGVRTVQLIHAVLRNVLGFAEKQGVLATNPVKRVVKPMIEAKEMRVLDADQVRILLNGAAGKPLGALLHLAVITGMRQGELLGLKWSDIDWLNATVKVQRQLQRIPGLGQVFSSPKTKNGIRTIQLGETTLQKLKSHKQLLDVRLEGYGNSEDLVFPSRNGKPKESRILGREFRELLRKLDLPPIRFHDLRHTAASLMLLSGMELIRIARQLGHSKPSITLDIYGHLIPGLENGAAQRLDELVASPNAADLQQQLENEALNQYNYP